MSAQELELTTLKNNANLKAYYRFESGALTTDSSGNGYTLTNNNTVGEGTGVFGGCADFGAGNTNKYLSVASDFGIDGGNTTISGWFKLHSEISSGVYSFVDFGSETNYIAYWMLYEYNAGTRRLTFNRQEQLLENNFLNYNVTLGTGWNHIALTYNGTTLRAYLNGSHIASLACSGNGSGAVADHVSIGRNDQYDYYASILADDVAIFSIALSADQIKELYEGRFIGEAWPQSGLVAGYHLNGGSTDFSGNNNHGTDTAITYSQANGKFGQGAGFNGSTSSVNFTKSNAALFDINTFTICGWANTPVGGGGTFFANYYRPSDITGYITYLGSTISFNVHKNASPSFKSTVANIDVRDGKWHHYAFVKSSTNYQDIYLDGNLVEHDTTDLYDANLWTNAVLNIGNRNGGDVPYTGKMDEILFFNRILTAQEIRRMYAVGTGKYY